MIWSNRVVSHKNSALESEGSSPLTSEKTRLRFGIKIPNLGSGQEN